VSRYDLDERELARLLDGEPPYRVAQVVHGLYRRLAEPAELTDLPKSLRARLAAAPELAPALAVVREARAEGGQTLKWLFSLADGARIETVLLHAPSRSTVCVSSQAGCAMACTFCATGQAGYERQLTAGEILEQIVRAARAAAAGGRRLDHVVFMGMGEPLANFDAVWDATSRAVRHLGLSARHITISTVGVVPGIRRLAEAALPVNLAVSLHAANDELRDRLVPLNRRYPLAALRAACEEYLARRRRRISFEWALIDGVNDAGADAAQLARLAGPLRAHVNLIPLNPTASGAAGGLAPSPPARVRAFRRALEELGVNATIRRTRGREIDAACGQLAARAPTPRRDAPGARTGGRSRPARTEASG